MSTSDLVPEISEPLTWAEICTRYPDEWVCLVEMDRVHPGGFEFRSARVVGHGNTRRAPFEQAAHWRDQYTVIGHYYTGRSKKRFSARRYEIEIIDDEA